MNYTELIKTKTDELGAVLKTAKDIRAKYEGVESDLKGDERERFDRAVADGDKLAGEIRDLEQKQRIDKLEGFLAEQKFELPVGPSNQPDPQAETKAAWNKYLVSGKDALGEAERKAMSIGVGTEGGYLKAPQFFVAELLKALDQELPFRRIARTFQVTGTDSLGAPELAADFGNPTWTGENSATTYDTTMTFGKRQLAPKFLKRGIKVSRHLIGRSPLSVDQIVRERMAYKLGYIQEYAFCNGTGNGQPLGVFTADADGIPTTQDSQTAVAGTIDSDALIGAYALVSPPHRANATWLFHDDVLMSIRRIKDSVNQYIWNPFPETGQFLVGGMPGTIMGRPYVVSAACPGKTNGSYVVSQYLAVVGDFRYYWIVDSLDAEIMVNPYLYADYDQIAYNGVVWCDGAPVVPTAFGRLINHS